MVAMQPRVLGAPGLGAAHVVRSRVQPPAAAAAAAVEAQCSVSYERSSRLVAQMGRLQHSLQHLALALQSAAAPVQQQITRASLVQRLLALREEQRLHVLLSAAAAPALSWADLGNNYVFMVGFCGWFVAQFLKIFTKRFKTGVWDAKAFLDAGGTPSSHSALCSAVTTAIAVQQGLSSPLFAVALCFSVIVMYDAMGVRRHAGLQAEVLNLVVEDLMGDDHPVAERRLKEVLGHTPRQVLAGALTGVLIGFFYRPC